MIYKTQKKKVDQENNKKQIEWFELFKQVKLVEEKGHLMVWDNGLICKFCRIPLSELITDLNDFQKTHNGILLCAHLKGENTNGF